MFKLKPFLPKSILLKIYYAILHPHLLFGLSIWESTYLAYFSLSVLQNKGVKAICSGHCHDHLSPIYTELKILKLPTFTNLKLQKQFTNTFETTFPLYYPDYLKRQTKYP